MWTIRQLSERVSRALAIEYDGQRSGRVREVPDARTIRWYTTTGLVDRPLAMRGRSALYGPRHLLQLVAIKRLQAEGRSLANIQAELVGATDAVLGRIARVPDDVPAADQAAEAAAPAAASLSTTPPAGAAPTAHAQFWATRPAPPTAQAAPAIEAEHRVSAGWTATHHTLDDVPAAVTGVRIGEGVTVILGWATRPLDSGDLAAIREAARPLLDAVRARGLVGDHDHILEDEQ